jgi:branched-chain amino acid transport system ATP-binding protein
LAAPPDTAPLLVVRDLYVSYGPVVALQGVSLVVPAGAIVTVLGANGAGKSTLLGAISGIVAVSSGSVELAGTPLRGRRPQEALRRGVAHVPEGRQLFAGLTVAHNLLLGGYVRPRGDAARRLDLVHQLFPILYDRREQRAGMLSGGEQQMLAIGRALMAEPKLLLLDEPSTGLAPMVRDSVFQTVAALRRDLGMTVLMVEQEVAAALALSEYVYVLQNGRVNVQGSAAEMLGGEALKHAYLGGSGTGGAGPQRPLGGGQREHNKSP